MNGLRLSSLQTTGNEQVQSGLVSFLDDTYFKISHIDAMPPFFMTIVSASDVWNFIWSNGGITAGRKNADYAIFPYYTADKVADGKPYTGSYTAIKVADGKDAWYWEPFSSCSAGIWNIERNLYKNTSGSSVYFEEINHDLALAFQYGWTSSDRFGLVRHSRILNLGKAERTIEILDGCQNIMPACTSADFQNANSVLLDAYKKNDLDQETGMALFAVSSIVTDKAEPSEGLFANAGWFSRSGKIYLAHETNEAFKYGLPLPETPVLKGQRPSHLLYQTIKLAAGAQDEWYQVFDTNLDASAAIALRETIRDKKKAEALLREDVKKTQAQLESYLAAADGIQHSAEEITCIHHKANVLFNIMRGGFFVDAYDISAEDLVAFVKVRNKALAPIMAQTVAGLGKTINYLTLLNHVRSQNNAQLERIALEYLPLTFSRRHGDPSRPWNRFSIELKDDKGRRKLNYQGNWRDIFQNWEALAYSYPGYIEGMVSKFLNALTPEGFNPYRITRDGIDWEVVEPDNPWSNIGYWGDHQVIYLLKLLEFQYNLDKKGLLAALDQPRYSSANVPYHLKPYKDILANPRSTIDFDHQRHHAIEKLVAELGTDAKLVLNRDKSVALVSFTAKFLAILLAKLANLVPGGGIWLNTQRPEWNDANNALAGYGLSMVTLYYLHRYVDFAIQLYSESDASAFALPEETYVCLQDLGCIFADTDPAAADTPQGRRNFMDRAGKIYETFRESLYVNGYSGKTAALSRHELLEQLKRFKTHILYTIQKNRRSDGLYHAYNTFSVEQDGSITLHYLDEMLEGQVAVLSSRALTGSESLTVFKALRHGRLFREDQYSYILYPDKELPHFLEKNRVPKAEVESIKLLKKLLEQDDHRIIKLDIHGMGHFNAQFRNAKDLEKMLHHIGAEDPDLAALVQNDKQAVLDLYEKTFHHRSFTGRSGTFYAYEGLGSIYWHMVSKLLLALQETLLLEQDKEIRQGLIEAYYDVRKGLGFNKKPEVYGAFPTDPYSHTPAGQGAKQPGMTGQVKEEVITRWGELGLSIRNGQLVLDPILLKKSEFLADSHLAFTYCGVPFEYRLGTNNEAGILVHQSIPGPDKTEVFKISGLALDTDHSRRLFNRDGSIVKIEAIIPASVLLS
ncbi:hypothetical protein [Gracilinema caldarium]|uniref:hypothetical protein n=1 Tax=Gracilinema caldarium TaxID=215591 RepID=UPI0026EE8A5D|nr:hypothetical protein [Gracilinema caldarium]